MSIFSKPRSDISVQFLPGVEVEVEFCFIPVLQCVHPEEQCKDKGVDHEDDMFKDKNVWAWVSSVGEVHDEVNEN